ncbi:MAG: 2Fe-2S iron-sulfur cluster-binding protein [Saprospiraceae bacterium]|nr:2Fe-2S iron-sulfur cluster-binding protein [Saprospiraceae bacterium]
MVISTFAPSMETERLEEAQENGLVRIEVLDRDDHMHHLEIPPDIGLNVMEACKANELPILGTCGGMALCGSCHVYVLSDHHLSNKSDEEEEMLDKLYTSKDNSRLCCQVRVDDRINGLRIKLAPE